MKHHLTLSTTSHPVLDHSSTAEAVAERAPAAEDPISMPRIASHTRPQLTLASDPVWKHKLILAGALDFRSAAELEEEIECLCEEGVTTLTLDLRELEAIDSSGVTAIARRGAVYKMRGRDFAVIPGSGVIRRALDEAGATDLLATDPTVPAAGGLPAAIVDHAASRSTVMIKSL